MQNVKRTIFAALCLLLLCACGAQSDAPALMEPVTISSDMATAAYGNIYDGMVLEGNILPQTQTLCFEASGRVGELCVDLGDRVEAGAPLVRLDTQMLQSRRDALADSLAYARQIDAYNNREAELNQQLLALQYGANSARCQLYASEQAEAARSRAAQISDLSRQLEEAEQNLSVQSVLTAPFAGTVAGLNVSVGDMVWPDAAVAVVTNDDTCFLQTEFRAEAEIAAATEVYATIGGVRYEVRYVPMDSGEYIAKTLSGQTMYSTFEIEGGTGELVGQYAILYLMTAQEEQVLCVPSNAVLRDAAGYYVYVDENGEKTRRDIEVGLMTAAQTEILSGLKEGERVYVVS